MKKQLLIILCVAFLQAQNSYASSNLAAEITYRNEPPSNALSYEITLTRYTNLYDTADLSSVIIKWGDGDTDTISRIDSALLCNNVLKSTYTYSHIYAGPGNYTVTYWDSPRTGNIVNFPDAGNYPFFVVSDIIIIPWFDPDSSVFFEDKPIMLADSGKIFRHNPAVVDADSLSFSLLDPDGGNGQYYIPAGLNINQVSGEIIWDKPDAIGRYEFLLRIREYRDGIMIGSVMRDFVIDVDSLGSVNYFNGTVSWDTNATGYFEYKIAPLTNLSLAFDYNDTTADSVAVSAYGEVFYVNNPATFNTITNLNQVNCSFDWTPDSSHARNHPYIVTFRGTSYIDTFCISQDITLLIYVEPPVFIEENYNNNYQISIYPNPARSELYIKGNFDTPATFELYDITGRKIYQQQVTSNRQPINISPLAKGLYVWQLGTARPACRSTKCVGRGKLVIE